MRVTYKRNKTMCSYAHSNNVRFNSTYRLIKIGANKDIIKYFTELQAVICIANGPLGFISKN